MDLTIQVIHARDFVRVTPRDALDFETMKQMLLAAVSTTSLPGNCDVLVDCRQADIRMYLADVINVVEAMTNNRSLFGGKLSFLPPEGEGYKALKFMEIYATNRGFHVAVFEEYEQAMNWLMPATHVPPTLDQ